MLIYQPIVFSLTFFLCVNAHTRALHKEHLEKKLPMKGYSQPGGGNCTAMCVTACSTMCRHPLFLVFSPSTNHGIAALSNT